MCSAAGAWTRRTNGFTVSDDDRIFEAPSISGGDKNGRSRKLFSRSLAMSAPSASTVTQPRSAAAKAARGRGRASLLHRQASSWSSPRSTTSCAPCRATTTMRTRTSARLPEDVAGSSKRTIDGRTRHLCRSAAIDRPCSACSLISRNSCNKS